MHRWIAHFVARLAKSFGPGHRSICIAQHIFRGAVAGAAKGNADTRRGEHRLSIDIKGCLNGLLDSFGHANSFTGIPDVIQQDREFIASQPRQYADLPSADRPFLPLPLYAICASSRRVDPSSRSAICTRSQSPAAIPRLSFTTLKRSMSTDNTANLYSGWSIPQLTHRVNRSRKKERFGRLREWVVKSIVGQFVFQFQNAFTASASAPSVLPHRRAW